MPVATEAVDDEDAGQSMAQKTGQHLVQHRPQCGLRERGPARRAPKVIGTAEWRHWRNECFCTGLGRTDGGAKRHSFCGGLVGYRYVRFFVLMTAGWRERHRVAGGALPLFAGAEFGQTPFRQWHFGLDQKILFLHTVCIHGGCTSQRTRR
jgi:hypothetical protein